MTKEELEVQVEQLIDKSNLHQVLVAISRVCGEKATHVAEAWQDRALARTWDQAGNVVDTAAMRASVLRVSG